MTRASDYNTLLSSADATAAIDAAITAGAYSTARDILENHRIAILCDMWTGLERACPFLALPEKDQTAIEARVVALATGQPVSGAGSRGDMAVRLAVQNYHMTSIEAHVAKQVFDAVFKRVPPQEITYRAFYDSLSKSYQCGVYDRMRLFGHTNVGNVRRSNMQIAGMLPPGWGNFLISSIWVTSLPKSDTLPGYLEMRINDRPVFTGQTHELLQHPKYLNVVLPEHANFDVCVYGGSAFPHDTVLYVHFDGWHRRPTY